ncbi:hypothetical protein L1887_09013 [Cichorium endivia]|nr:hypothetical protein L1887_09013 [Cichorium endivia]
MRSNVQMFFETRNPFSYIFSSYVCCFVLWFRWPDFNLTPYLVAWIFINYLSSVQLTMHIVHIGWGCNQFPWG